MQRLKKIHTQILKGAHQFNPGVSNIRHQGHNWPGEDSNPAKWTVFRSCEAMYRF